jgi:hypothetical protein
MSIRASWRNYQLKKTQQAFQLSGVFKGYDKLQKVLLFCGYDQRKDKTLQKFVQELEADGKSVVVVAYFARKRKELPEEEQQSHHILCKSDLNWYGKPKSGWAQTHLLNQYDLAIDTVYKNREVQEFLRALMQADFLIGAVEGKSTVPNIVVHTQETQDLSAFFKEVHYYIHFINHTS